MNASLTGPIWLSLLAVALAGCPTPVASPEQSGAASSQPAPGGLDPASELATLDTREAVPLQPMMAWHQKQNMMEHLSVIQQVVAGLADEDWEGIAGAAVAIEASPQMKQMCNHMGAGAPGFTEMALDFHDRAGAIRPAAVAHDGTAVLRATSHTLAACVRCHATYRQDVVDVATWEQRAGTRHEARDQAASGSSSH